MAVVSRRTFLFCSPIKTLEAGRKAIIASTEAEHPKLSGPMITGVKGGLSWEMLAMQPSDGSRFTEMQEQWDGESAIIGGYVVPVDHQQSVARQYLWSASPAHCADCITNPIRWRVLVSFDTPTLPYKKPMYVRGILTMVRHPKAPFFYRLHADGPESVGIL